MIKTVLKRIYSQVIFVKNKIFWYSDFINSCELLTQIVAKGLPNPLEVTHKYSGHGFFKTISASQNKKEFDQFYKYLSEKKLDTIVEIGTDKGGTLFVWSTLVERGGLIVSMDLESRRNYSSERRKFYSLFCLIRFCTIKFIPGNSHLIETKKLLLNSLSGRKVDFLFIDGDHSYNGVKEDYYLYEDIVKDGGVIAFHDIRTDRENCGVPKFWNEIKEVYGKEHFEEFCENDYSPLGGGIGALIKK